MALKRVELESAPSAGELPYLTEVYVKNGAGYDHYIGDVNNDPVLIGQETFAPVAGDSTQTFDVAPPSAAEHAVRRDNSDINNATIENSDIGLTSPGKSKVLVLSRDRVASLPSLFNPHFVLRRFLRSNDQIRIKLRVSNAGVRDVLIRLSVVTRTGFTSLTAGGTLEAYIVADWGSTGTSISVRHKTLVSGHNFVAGDFGFTRPDGSSDLHITIPNNANSGGMMTVKCDIVCNTAIEFIEVTDEPIP